VESDNRTYKGFNFYSVDDQKLFEVLARGEFSINGLYNKSLRQHFPNKSSSALSRVLKRLRVHGIIKRVARTYKYYLTKLGKAVITAGLAIKEMFVVPELAKLRLQYR
jgi:DNA-binding HxlR family transcriptional regulator